MLLPLPFVRQRLSLRHCVLSFTFVGHEFQLPLSFVDALLLDGWNEILKDRKAVIGLLGGDR